MSQGRLELHVRCLVCNHLASIPHDELVARYGPDYLRADIERLLRCSCCRAKGRVETILGWAGVAPGASGEPSRR